MEASYLLCLISVVAVGWKRWSVKHRGWMQSDLQQIPLIMQWSRQVTNAEILKSEFAVQFISKVRLYFMLVMSFTSASFVSKPHKLLQCDSSKVQCVLNKKTMCSLN